ncbi:MAG TPA: serine hydrolase [Candidatus Acidoferrales bacterium]|nr:serine hydrolase [Candidatus Acidoferrales bacterium]
MALEAALAYAQRHTLHALVVAREHAVVYERYGDGYDRERAHALYSGTKSFWGVTALAAQQDGILDLDERAAQTLTEWRDQERKREVTIRQLLQLSAGFGFGGLGNAVPTYDIALHTPLRDAPGTHFTYGGIPLQVFGALLTRKLASRGLTPHAYLQQRLLTPLGITVGDWRTLKDGTHPLPTGAQLSAAAWLRYGRFLAGYGCLEDRRLDERLMRLCWEPSAANPRYGLAFWLDPTGRIPGLLYASGAGGQALYVIPSVSLVVVHFGKSTSFRHETFLRHLLPLAPSEV